LISRLTTRICFSLLLGLLLASPGASTLRAQTVVILTSDSLISTKRTIQGAKKVIEREYSKAAVKLCLLSPRPGDYQRQIDSIKASHPDILLTVGSAPTAIAKQHFHQTPIVFSSVMYPAVSGFVVSLDQPGKNITGASLDIPIDIQFEKFKKIVPGLSTIGVLYSNNTASLIPQAKTIARRYGMSLLAIKIHDQKDLPSAMDSLTRVCDGIWSVADPNLFSPQSTKFILLHSIRAGVPFMGFSRYVVESGALFALDFDYKAVGRQAGGIVNKILDGQSPDSIKVTVPDIIWFHYNEKTAEHINIDIPSDLVAIAKEVYR
jgi:putative ABC transport system substrate-binding protein